MFIHNLKYTIKTLFRKRALIFWTFIFPILLGIFFNMAFSNIEKDEALQIFDIAIIDNENYNSQEIYKDVLEELAKDDNEDKLFNIKYVDEEEANQLLENSSIKGYILFKDNEPNVVVKENSTYQTIIKFVLNQISQEKKMVEELTEKRVEEEIKNFNFTFDVEKIANEIVDKIENQDVNLKNISNSNLSYTMIEYYTLIAMACMYGGMIGLTAINTCLANMSNKGKRIAVSPTRKSIVVLSSLIGSYIVSLIGIGLLFVFLLFGIKVDFGNNMPLVLLMTALGDLAGIAFGTMIASCFKTSEGMKTGIILALSMVFSALSGMMGITLKYVIDMKMPILNLINPNNLIVDGFYSLYYYTTLDRFFRDIGCLGIFIVVCLVISYIALRREKYDSI